MFGETTSSPLHTLEALLSKVYQPLFHAQDQWGKAEKEQVAEFRAAVDRFTEDMENALKSLVDGLELRKPDAKYDLDTARTSAGLKDEAMISHFESAFAAGWAPLAPPCASRRRLGAAGTLPPCASCCWLGLALAPPPCAPRPATRAHAPLTPR